MQRPFWVVDEDNFCVLPKNRQENTFICLVSLVNMSYYNGV